ncbi:hypothetical protein [Parafilimonas sp.]|uniref:hypothetical protein n=1 Tax=Parafilimonas sp. TaxID=1969739 RepID=UPI0039E5CED1
MCEGYALEWLDSFITVTLNPAATKLAGASAQDAQTLQKLAMQEKDKASAAIKSAVFNINDSRKTRCLIKKYYASLICLSDQALKTRRSHSGHSVLKKLAGSVFTCIDELLLLIEQRFRPYLSSRERMPVIQFLQAKHKLLSRLGDIEKRLTNHHAMHVVFSSIKPELQSFLSPGDGLASLSFREVMYVECLCREMENIETSGATEGIYTRLDEVLISINFNTDAYAASLIGRVANHISGIQQTDEKIKSLLYQFKMFKQFTRMHGNRFNLKNASLYKRIGNWFKQEISYYEEQLFYSGIALKKDARKNPERELAKQKILCMLSVDQLALVLRAADELKIIAAPSLNSVFKSIVPYLSTPNRESISYNSMRGKSYTAEPGDIQIIIQALHEMIKRIKKY